MEQEIKCDLCEGTGEVSSDVRDSDGNISSGVDTDICSCRENDGDEDNT